MRVIPPCNSLSVAQKVRRMVNKYNTDGRLCGRGNWRSFDNCREQGFVLRIRGRLGNNFHIAFSECRNSDEIVVYCYQVTGFPTNLPAVDHWNDTRYFSPGDYKGAAGYVLLRSTQFLDDQKM